MKLKLLLTIFLSVYYAGFSQNSNKENKTTPFDTINISKRFFDFSKCPKEHYNKCFDDVSPDQIFNFIGVSSTKDSKKQVYRQIKNYIIANIDEEIFLSTINNNHIKFKKPYLNITFWVDKYGKPDTRFFGSNITNNKGVNKKLKFIISQIYFDKNFYADFDRLRNKQMTLFIPVGKKGTKYIIDPRTEEEKEFYKSKVKNTFPPYFKSCNGLEGTSEFSTLEKKEGIKKCMEYNFTSFLQNNFNKEIVRRSVKRLKDFQGIEEPKFRAFASFKIDENGKPCEYQALSIFPEIEREVLRVIQKIPLAKPATLNGKKVKYKFRIPMKFH